MNTSYSPVNSREIQMILSGSYTPPSGTSINFVYNGYDIDFSGNGRLVGSLKVKDVPTKGFIKILYNTEVGNRYGHGALVAEFETDDVGNWSYNGLNEYMTFDVIMTAPGWQDRTLTKIHPKI